VNKNDTRRSQAPPRPKVARNPKNGYIFILLIVLLFYTGPLLASAAQADASKYLDYLYLYTVIAYSLIIVSITFFHRNGLDVFQDHFSLWTISLGCVLAASQGGTHAVLYKVFLLILGIGFAIYIIVRRKNYRTPDLKSVFTALLWSVLTTVTVSVLLFFISPFHEPFPRNIGDYFLNSLLYQLAFVTVIEEACFRGLLFGFLVMNRYEEDRALTLQAVLFWGSHYLKISNVSLFFVAIPLLTLSLTMIIKKYKMLYMSVMVHTVANVLGPVLVVILQFFR
jgi:membrane protease YdiL (CAAX protease family)